MHQSIVWLVAAAPPLAGQAVPAAGTAGTAANGAGGAPAPTGAAPSLLDGSFVWILMLMLVGMVVMSMFSSRKEKKRRQSMLSAIKRHDRVQTIGGVIGSVFEVKPDVVVLKVDESSNTKLTFARSAIQQVLKESPAENETP